MKHSQFKGGLGQGGQKGKPKKPGEREQDPRNQQRFFKIVSIFSKYDFNELVS